MTVEVWDRETGEAIGSYHNVQTLTYDVDSQSLTIRHGSSNVMPWMRFNTKEVDFEVSK